MLSHRDGKLVIICDGCYRPICAAVIMTIPRGSEASRNYAAADGRLTMTQKVADNPDGSKRLLLADVCSPECGKKWFHAPAPSVAVPSEA